MEAGENKKPWSIKKNLPAHQQLTQLWVEKVKGSTCPSFIATIKMPLSKSLNSDFCSAAAQLPGLNVLLKRGPPILLKPP